MPEFPNAYLNDKTKCPKCGSTEGTFPHDRKDESPKWYGCDACGNHFTKSKKETV